MKYTSLQQIFDDKERVFGTLKQIVVPLSSSQLSFRTAEGQWTIAEIIEHLVLVESRLLKLVNVSSHRLEKTGTPGSTGSALSIEIPYGTERHDFFKVKTKEEYEPSGTVPCADSMTKLQTIHDDLFALRPRLEQIDLTAVSFDHWLFGTLSLGQWLAFIGVHQQRHLSQIRSILDSAQFPKK